MARMSEQLLAEGLHSVVDAAAHVGSKISSKTALRWCLNGIRGTRLESVKVAGRRTTSRAAVSRFICATQPVGRPQQPRLDARSADRVLHTYGLGREQCR